MRALSFECELPEAWQRAAWGDESKREFPAVAPVLQPASPWEVAAPWPLKAPFSHLENDGNSTSLWGIVRIK